VSVTVKVVKMKALSPFLPDAPTLASLFAGAGVLIAAEANDRERSRPRATGSNPPTSSRLSQGTLASTVPGSPASATSTLPSTIRFPVSTVTATIPSKGPLRASIPPLEPANAATPGATIGATPGATIGATSSGVHVVPPRAHTGSTTPPATVAVPPSAAAATEQLTDEAALQLMFGRRDRGAPPLQQRFEAFVDWLATGVGAQASFVADVDGLVLANRNVPETYVVAIASLSHAEQSVLDYMPRPQEGSTMLELDETRYLQVIRVETVVGRLIIGAIVAAPLSRTICAMVRRLMRIGVEWEAVR
jgi:hypothetical protein